MVIFIKIEAAPSGWDVLPWLTVKVEALDPLLIAVHFFIFFVKVHASVANVAISIQEQTKNYGCWKPSTLRYALCSVSQVHFYMLR